MVDIYSLAFKKYNQAFTLHYLILEKCNELYTGFYKIFSSFNHTYVFNTVCCLGLFSLCTPKTF